MRGKTVIKGRERGRKGEERGREKREGKEEKVCSRNFQLF